MNTRRTVSKETTSKTTPGITAGFITSSTVKSSRELRSLSRILEPPPDVQPSPPVSRSSRLGPARRAEAVKDVSAQSDDRQVGSTKDELKARDSGVHLSPAKSIAGLDSSAAASILGFGGGMDLSVRNSFGVSDVASSYSKALGKARQNNEDYMAIIEKQIGEIAALQVEISSKDERILGLILSESSAKKRNSDVSDECDLIRVEIRSLQTEICSKDDEINALKSELTGANEKNVRLTNELREFKLDSEKMIKECSLRFENALVEKRVALEHAALLDIQSRTDSELIREFRLRIGEMEGDLSSERMLFRESLRLSSINQASVTSVSVQTDSTDLYKTKLKRTRTTLSHILGKRLERYTLRTFFNSLKGQCLGRPIRLELEEYLNHSTEKKLKVWAFKNFVSNYRENIRVLAIREILEGSRMRRILHTYSRYASKAGRERMVKNFAEKIRRIHYDSKRKRSILLLWRGVLRRSASILFLWRGFYEKIPDFHHVTIGKKSDAIVPASDDSDKMITGNSKLIEELFLSPDSSTDTVDIVKEAKWFYETFGDKFFTRFTEANVKQYFSTSTAETINYYTEKLISGGVFGDLDFEVREFAYSEAELKNILPSAEKLRNTDDLDNEHGKQFITKIMSMIAAKIKCNSVNVRKNMCCISYSASSTSLEKSAVDGKSIDADVESTKRKIDFSPDTSADSLAGHAPSSVAKIDSPGDISAVEKDPSSEVVISPLVEVSTPVAAPSRDEKGFGLLDVGVGLSILAIGGACSGIAAGSSMISSALRRKKHPSDSPSGGLDPSLSLTTSPAVAVVLPAAIAAPPAAASATTVGTAALPAAASAEPLAETVELSQAERNSIRYAELLKKSYAQGLI